MSASQRVQAGSAAARDNKQATLDAAGACILNLTAVPGVKEMRREDAG